MEIFDSHAHYDSERFDADRDTLLPSLKKSGVAYVANIGCDLPSSRKSVALAEKYDFVWATVGVHPHNTDDMIPQDMYELEKLLRHGCVVALGEIGLDYYHDFSPRAVQLEKFALQMELAEATQTPVVIHMRDSAQDCLDIVRRFKVPRGVFHCYSGSLETAKTLVNMGYWLGFTGVITFSNAKKSHDVLRWIPRDRILIETDCPYLTPEPHRGKRNDSTMLVHTLQALGAILGISADEAARLTTDNSKAFYGIK